MAGSAARWTARLLGERSLRSLLMTPWFVAGTGVLITATLVLQSPTDAVLSYGPPAGSPCGSPKCVTSPPKRSPGSLAGKGGVQLHPAGGRNGGAGHSDGAAPSHQPVSRRAAPAADVSVKFDVLSQDHRGWIAMITLSSRHRLGDWTLGFTIPGTSIRGVGGAGWRGDGGDSGTAQAQSSRWGWAGPDHGMARFMVFGTGVPGQPTGCTFDNRGCVFS